MYSKHYKSKKNQNDLHFGTKGVVFYYTFENNNSCFNRDHYGDRMGARDIKVGLSP